MTAWQERERSLELINYEFDNRIASQADLGRAIDTKATFLLGATAVAAQVFLSLDRDESWSVVAFLAFIATIGAGLKTIWPVGYRTQARPGPVVQRYRELLAANTVNLKEQLLGKLIGTKQEVIDHNVGRYNTKVRWWRASLVALVAALVLSGASILEAPVEERDPGDTPTSEPADPPPAEITPDPAWMDNETRGGEPADTETKDR